MAMDFSLCLHQVNIRIGQLLRFLLGLIVHDSVKNVLETDTETDEYWDQQMSSLKQNIAMAMNSFITTSKI